MKPTDIKQMVDDIFGSDISSKVKDTPLCTARCVYYDLCEKYCRLFSLSEIGRAVGRDHATVLHWRKYNPIRKTEDYQELWWKCVNLLPAEVEPMEERSSEPKKKGFLKRRLTMAYNKIEALEAEVSSLRGRMDDDAFIYSLKELSPSEYEQFKQRSRVILKFIKEKMTI